MTTDPAAAGAGPDAASVGVAGHGAPLVGAVGVLAVLVAFVVAGALELRHPWYPGSDYALAELYVRQIPHHLVDMGPYSAGRGFFHPLPYGFYAVWLPYEVFGRASAALLTGSMWFNGVVSAGIAWFLVRRRRAALALLLVVAVGVVVRVDTRPLVLVPWNPYLAALPFLALLVVAPSVWRGERWSAPLAVALASWSAGVHLLFAPTAVAVVVVALAGMCRTGWRRRRTESPRHLVAPLAASFGAAVVLWLPTIVDVVRRGGDGNTGHIVRFMLDPGSASLSARDVLALTSSELAWHPTWAGAEVRLFLASPSMRFPVFLILGGLAAFAAWRRRSGWELTALGFGALSIAVAAYSLARTSWLVGDWYLLPLRLSSVWFCCVTVYSLGRSGAAWLRSRGAWPPARNAPVVPAAAVLALWAGAAVLVAWPSARPGFGTLSPRPDVSAVSRTFRRGAPVVALTNLARPSAVSVGYVLALDRAGLDVHVPPDQEWFFGPWRARAAPAGAARVWITQEPTGGAPPQAGAELVYRSRPLPQFFGPDLPVRIWVLR